MFLLIGLIMTIASVLGGYMMHGGNVGVLWQPSELIIIGGAGLFSFVASNSPSTVKGLIPALIATLKGSGVNKEFYTQLLGMMANVFEGCLVLKPTFQILTNQQGLISILKLLIIIT